MLLSRSVFVKTTMCAGTSGTWTQKRRETELASRALVEFNSVFGQTGNRMRRRQFTPLMMLAFEANGVIALRTLKLMLGGRSARREAELMVSEKIHAAFEAGASLMSGASGDDIIHRYREHVARNAKRLGSRSKLRKRRRSRTA